jgi:Pyruvate/2-oxoacid:ferredoxin oxidoreductase delta subunit
MSHLALLDDASIQRKSLLKLYFSNILDLLEFYYFLSRLTRIPILGSVVLKSIINFYGYNYHTGMALPLKEVLEILEEANYITVSHCACRTLYQRCHQPLMTCLYINTGGQIYLDKGILPKEKIDRHRAKEIVTESIKHGMILSFEWCLPPYSYAICSCCPCCCLPRKLRFDYGIEAALQAGPFHPVREEGICLHCQSCIAICPGKAISWLNGSWYWSQNACIGCGLCAEKCPQNRIEMVPRRILKKLKPEPGIIKKNLLWLGAMTILLPLAFSFAWVKRKKGTKNAPQKPVGK